MSTEVVLDPMDQIVVDKINSAIEELIGEFNRYADAKGYYKLLELPTTSDITYHVCETGVVGKLNVHLKWVNLPATIANRDNFECINRCITNELRHFVDYYNVYYYDRTLIIYLYDTMQPRLVYILTTVGILLQRVYNFVWTNCENVARKLAKDYFGETSFDRCYFIAGRGNGKTALAQKMMLNSKIFKKESKPMDFEKIIVNGPATIGWINGKKYVVKCAKEDEYDLEKAILALYVKSIFSSDERFHGWMRRTLKQAEQTAITEYKGKEAAEKGVEEMKSTVQRRHDRWTQSEIDFLYLHHNDMTNKQIGDALGRSVSSVASQKNVCKITQKRVKKPDVSNGPTGA